MGDETHYVACYGGLSSTLVRVVTPDAVHDVTAAPIRLDRPVATQLAHRIGQTLPAERAQWAVAVGTVGHCPDTADELLRAIAPLGVTRVVAAHDVVADYLGAIGPTSGAVVVADATAACLAMGPHDTARVDGWGPLIGGAGSAFWIGRTALEAATRGYDGRRQMTALTQAMADTFGDIETAYLHLLTHDALMAIAGFSDTVMELAASDRVAGNILDKAAAHLSEAVHAGIRRAGLTAPRTPHVAAVGRVFSSRHVLTRFTDYLSLQWPSFALVEAEAGPLEGAAELLHVAEELTLQPHISVAG